MKGCEIIRHIATYSHPEKNWDGELNVVSWHNQEPVYDISYWREDHERCIKGMTFTKEELLTMYKYFTKFGAYGSTNRQIMNEIDNIRNQPFEVDSPTGKLIVYHIAEVLGQKDGRTKILTITSSLEGDLSWDVRLWDPLFAGCSPGILLTDTQLNTIMMEFWLDINDGIPF